MSQGAEQTAFKRACRQIAKITMASGLKSSITFWIINDMKVSDPQDNTMNFLSFANSNNIGGALRCLMDTDTHIHKHVPPCSEEQQGKTKNWNTERDRGVGVDDVLSPTETIAALVGGGRLHRHGHRSPSPSSFCCCECVSSAAAVLGFVVVLCGSAMGARRRPDDHLRLRIFFNFNFVKYIFHFKFLFLKSLSIF